MLIRLSKFLKHKNLSFNKFEIAIEVSHGSISNAFKYKKNIGSNVIEKILKNYPEISAEWLLRGEGVMLKSNQIIETSSNAHSYNSSNEDLIKQTLQFLNLNNKAELHHFFNNSLEENLNNTLEQKILSTWEKKYGQELKSIKHQLMTLFVDKLDRQQNSKSETPNSKIG